MHTLSRNTRLNLETKKGRSYLVCRPKLAGDPNPLYQRGYASEIPNEKTTLPPFHKKKRFRCKKKLGDKG